MFSELLSRYSTTIDPVGLLLDLLLAMVMGYAVSWLYLSVVRSPEKTLARLFPLLSAALALASTLLASSLGIALALVGALSIIRFRNVTPSLEQSAFLFLTIGLGLAVGIGQLWMALLAFALIAPAMVWIYHHDKIRPSQMTLSLKGEADTLADHLLSLQTDIPSLEFRSMEQEGSRAQYQFVFKAHSLQELLPVRERLAAIPGLQYAFTEQDED